MKKEEKLIKCIDQNLQNPKRLYWLSLENDDLLCMRNALTEKLMRESRIESGDVVSDFGYHGAVVVTRIHQNGNCFDGYYVADGAVVQNLTFVDEKRGGRRIFKKIAERSGNWRLCRGGAFFQEKAEDGN